MDYSHLTLLLQLVKIGSDIDPLLSRGLTYSQIAELTNIAIKDGFLCKTGHDLTITTIGEQRLKKLENGKISASGNWIAPEVKSRIEKKDIYHIYLPKAENAEFI
ncbi:MAG: hypothetical protein FPO08_05250 [Geobacter sp.]|nr:MAG: hypothetical protein FPO08_05250 [Geobacter sp.]